MPRLTVISSIFCSIFLIFTSANELRAQFDGKLLPPANLRGKFIDKVVSSDSPSVNLANFKEGELAQQVRTIVKHLESRKSWFGEKARYARASITFHPDKPATVSFVASPAMQEEGKQGTGALIKELQEKLTIKSRFFDSTFHVSLNVGGGVSEQKNLPLAHTADNARIIKIRDAEAAERLQIIRDFVVDIAMPVAALRMSSVAEEFKGVRALGKLLAELEVKRGAPKAVGVDVAKLLDANPDYWRAYREMMPTDPTVLQSRIFLYVLNGNLDLAYRFAEIHVKVRPRGQAVMELLAHLHQLLQIHHAKTLTELESALKGKSADATAALAKLETVLPHSLAVRNASYRLKSKAAEMTVAEAEQLWKMTDVMMQKLDPLFLRSRILLEGQNRTKEEAWCLQRRNKIAGIVKGQLTVKRVIEYADAAQELGFYPLTAELYWTTAAFGEKDPGGERDFMVEALLMMHMSGAKNVGGQYKLDSAHMQQKFEDEMAKRRQSLKAE